MTLVGLVAEVSIAEEGRAEVTIPPGIDETMAGVYGAEDSAGTSTAEVSEETTTETLASEETPAASVVGTKDTSTVVVSWDGAKLVYSGVTSGTVGVDTAVIGQIVVEIAMVSVVTEPMGQFVTVAGHSLIV